MTVPGDAAPDLERGNEGERNDTDLLEYRIIFPGVRAHPECSGCGHKLFSLGNKNLFSGKSFESRPNLGFELKWGKSKMEMLLFSDF